VYGCLLSRTGFQNACAVQGAFCKNLAKVFCFSANKGGKDASAVLIILYNLRSFIEISGGFGAGQISGMLVNPGRKGVSQGVASPGLGGVK